MGVATGWVILRHRPYRRNLLFITTLVTLALVFAGAVPLAKVLMARPMSFFLFWALCFLLAGFVLMLAVYDLLQIRREHQERMDQLEDELSEAAEEARRLAQENLQKLEDSKGEQD
ncbi:MAG: hypothetical protein CMO55_00445 [Verrucomicrobiales bacterium]|nr:hypothetical protein [Verrucomicrobiales bacterium]